MWKSIFTSDDFSSCDENYTVFIEVKFLKDFGIFKKDDEVKYLYVDYENSLLVEKDDDDNDLERKQSFIVEAVIATD